MEAAATRSEPAPELRALLAAQQRTEQVLAELVAAQRAVEAALAGLPQQLRVAAAEGAGGPTSSGGRELTTWAEREALEVPNSSTAPPFGAAAPAAAGVSDGAGGDLADAMAAATSLQAPAQSSPSWRAPEDTAPLVAYGPQDLVAPTLPARWPASLEVQGELAHAPSSASRVDVKGTVSSAPTRHSQSLRGEDMRQQAARRTWLRDPTSCMHSALALAGLLVLLHDVVVIPYAMAWQLQFEGYLRASAYFSVSFWTVDIGLSFVRGFYGKDELVTTSRAIAKEYLRTWFVPDVVVTVCDWLTCLFFSDAGGGDSNATGVKFLRFAKVGRCVRLVGILRMMRVLRGFWDLVERHQLSEQTQWALSIVSLMSATLFSTHLIACAWLAVGRYGYSDTGAHWIDAALTVQVNGESALFADQGVQYQYATAFHWGLAQLVLGSIETSCTNTSERAFNVFCMILGFTAGTLIISSVSARMVEYQTWQRDKVQPLRRLRRYLIEVRVDATLAAMTLRQARERLNARRPLTPEDVPVLQLLSSGLRKELHTSLCIQPLLQHPLFRLWSVADEMWFGSLCSEAIDIQYLSENDDLFAPGTVASAAYVLVSGRLKYRQVPESSPVLEATMRDVAQESWLCESALWLHWIHVGVAEAMKRCKLLRLRTDLVLRALRRHHTICFIARAYCLEFHRRMAAARPPLAQWPDDLHVPATTFEELVVSMPRGVVASIGLIAVDHHFSTAGDWDVFFPLQQFVARWPREEICLKLKAELQEGRCAVVLDATGKAVRITSVVLLRVANAEGRFLWQLGKVHEDHLVVKAEMPGAKRSRGESSTDAVKRLFATQLLPLAGCVVERLEHNVTEQMSREYGLYTKYLCTVCHGKLEVPFEAPCCTSDFLGNGDASMRQRGSGRVRSGVPGFSGGLVKMASAEDPFRELFEERPVYAVEHAGTSRLYAWLSTQEIEKLRTRSGEQFLRAWLAELRVPEESGQAI